MSLQIQTRQILKHVMLLIGSDANLLRILRGVVSRDFPGFFPMEFLDLSAAREALADLDCDMVLAYCDPKQLLASAFFRLLPETTPFILFADALEAARPVVAREARVRTVLDSRRPRADVLSTQIKQALAHKAQALFGELRSQAGGMGPEDFAARATHVLLLDPASAQIRRDLHGLAMAAVQVYPQANELAQVLIDNIKRLELQAGVEPQLLWEAARVAMGLQHFNLARPFLDTLSQKEGQWRTKALTMLAELALKQDDITARRKYVMALADDYEQRGDFRGMASALEDYLLTHKPNLDLAFKLLKALHHLGESEKEGVLLTSLLSQSESLQQLPALFVRLQLVYGSMEKAAHFLRPMPQVLLGYDQLWLSLADHFLKRGDGLAASAFAELLSHEGVTLQFAKVMELAYRLQSGDFALPAQQLYKRVKGINPNVDLY